MSDANFSTMPLRFRVWDKNQECFLTATDDDGIEREKMGIRDLAELISWAGEDNIIISQDTDLKDKNGKSIYTGDIVYYRPYGSNVSVLYRDGMVVIKIRQGEEYYISHHLDDIEIIGNIWQNPELLKGEE